jgi:hypothetical protein
MAIGDQNDIAARLKRWLPTRWFPAQDVNSDGSAPRVAAMRQGLAANLASVYAQLQYALAQTRIGSSSDGWLDLFAFDYFGRDLPRWSGETDARYQPRVAAELTRDRGTRPAIAALLTALVGAPPTIFEPWRPLDTGAYGVAAVTGYGVAGGYGRGFPPPGTAGAAGYGVGRGGYGVPTSLYSSFALDLGIQGPRWFVFIRCPVPQGYGIANAGGYGVSRAAGYGVATTLLYSSGDYLRAAPTTTQILAQLNRVRAAGIQMVVTFYTPANATPLELFILGQTPLGSLTPFS